MMNMNMMKFVNNLYSIEKVFQKSSVLVLGDFNLSSVSWIPIEGERFFDPILGWTKYSEVVDTFSYLGFLQYNYISNSNLKILDLILCNKTNSMNNLKQSSECLVAENINNKATEFILRLRPVKPSVSSNLCFYNLNKADFVAVNQQLSNVEWSREITGRCVDLMVDRFYTKIYSIIERFVSNRRVRCGFPVYFSNKTIEIIRKKKKHHKKYKDLNA